MIKYKQRTCVHEEMGVWWLGVMQHNEVWSFLKHYMRILCLGCSCFSATWIILLKLMNTTGYRLPTVTWQNFLQTSKRAHLNWCHWMLHTMN